MAMTTRISTSVKADLFLGFDDRHRRAGDADGDGTSPVVVEIEMDVSTEFSLADLEDQTIFNCFSGADSYDFVVLRTEAAVLSSRFLQADDSAGSGRRVGDAERQFVCAFSEVGQFEFRRGHDEIRLYGRWSGLEPVGDPSSSGAEQKQGHANGLESFHSVFGLDGTETDARDFAPARRCRSQRQRSERSMSPAAPSKIQT